MFGSYAITLKPLLTTVLSASAQQWKHTRHARNALLTARTFCNKPNNTEEKSVRPPPTYSGQAIYRNEKRPTPFDKKVLLWARRFKKEEDIPETVSYELLSAAQSKVRVMTCYLMIALTVLGCVAMVIAGKDAVRKENTLVKRNLERKAKWRAEKELEVESLKEQ
ncbi:protein FAM162A-like [Ambystoma mexicanum]|uniref:protein FAM162A-like n=1 Tax=Ambystoma mexicanum TaxID=8296 RepID=UPI0037E80CD4